MVGVLVLTHGPLANELLAAATTISGAEAEGVEALCLEWNIEPEEAFEQVRAACAAAAGDEGLLVLTDMYGGTPHNVARRVAENGSVELVSGVNLPMVVRLLCSSRDQLPLNELVDWIAAKGCSSIRTSHSGCD